MEYVGAAYAGFQSQPGKVTVQGTIEQAITSVTQENIRVIGSGRTDVGAHAVNQVISFCTESSLAPAVLLRAINAHLPMDIAITSTTDEPPAFHPRYDASSRMYHYLIWNRPVRSPFFYGRAAHVKPELDDRAMHQAAQFLLGEHDFSAFVPINHTGRRTRTIFLARVFRRANVVTIELEASGFMRQMVRAIAGTLIDVGRKKLSADDFAVILASGKRTAAGETAPAWGLYLVDVHYPGVTDAGTSANPWWPGDHLIPTTGSEETA